MAADNAFVGLRISLKAAALLPFSRIMVRSFLESAAAGLSRTSDRFERSAMQLARASFGFPTAETAATLELSLEARGAAQTDGTPSNAGLEGALLDTRIAKYQFIANLRVLQSGDEMTHDLLVIGKK